MGKTKAVDPARVREKLDILEPRLAALLKQADEETDMKKKVKLAKRRIRSVIKYVRQRQESGSAVRPRGILWPIPS